LKINLIVALDKECGFSKNGAIPWINEDFAKEDLKNFRKLTLGNTCIMGRKTYEDISNFMNKIDILSGRECVVLSNDPTYYISQNTLVYDSLDHAIGTSDPTKNIFIIGGLRLFEEALKWDLDNVYITMIDDDYECDKFFPYEKLIENYRLLGEGISKEYSNVKYMNFIKK
jgi:dihydrofolate reductase